MNLTEFKSYIKNKKVAVVGIGRSNMPLIYLLHSFGAKILACDKKEDIGSFQKELSSLGVELSLGDNYLKGIKADIVFRTPGIRPDIEPLENLKKEGAIITSEMDLFFELCPCEIFAVTGSDGKTTTTTLIYEMLKKAGYACHLGGNIGRPLIGDIEKIEQNHKVIVELSSFQLFDIKHSPKVAVITNITPNHLDWHKNYEEYIDAKKRILYNMSESGRFVVNRDCDLTKNIGENLTIGEKIGISFNEEADVYFDGENIVAFGEKYFAKKDIRIVGNHNVYNYMAAIAATKGYITKEQAKAVATEFAGVEHRIEFIRELEGVKYYNSSIDSSPNRTINTLSVFDKNVVLICGGKDKGIPYDEIGLPICEKVKTLILIGKTAQVIKDAVEKAKTTQKPQILMPQSYEEAVNMAKNSTLPGDVVLLSPASTSFDLFANFEERGNLFKKLVNNL